MPNVGQLNTNRTWGAIMSDLLEEFAKWNISRDEIILPVLAKSQDEVRVEFAYKGDYRPIACSRFSHQHNGAARNLAAILSVVKSTRLADQRGIGQVLADMSSFLALPDPDDPYRVLGVTPGMSKNDIHTKYIEAIRNAHPDRGGSTEAFQRVHQAGKALGVAQ